MTHIEAQRRARPTLVRYLSAIKVDIVPKVGLIRIDKLTRRRSTPLIPVWL